MSKAYQEAIKDIQRTRGSMMLKPSPKLPHWPHLELPFFGEVALAHGKPRQVMMMWDDDAKELHFAIAGAGYEKYVGQVGPLSVAAGLYKLPLNDTPYVADLINAQFGIDTNHARYEGERQ
jgi:hypothetical protein